MWLLLNYWENNEKNVPLFVNFFVISCNVFVIFASN